MDEEHKIDLHITVSLALKNAVDNGWLKINDDSFQDFDTECDCIECQTLTVLHGYLMGDSNATN